MGWNDVLGNENGREKIAYSKFERGSTIIRILDNEPYSFWSHWMPQQKTSVTCLGKGCPVCNINAQMKSNGQKPTYGNSHRHAMRIWNYKTNQMEIMIQGKKFFTDLLNLHKEVGEITTYDIKVIRNGEGTETSYMLVPQAVSDFKVTDDMNITDVDLSEMLHAPTYDEMVQLINGKTWEEINEARKESDDAPFDENVA